MQGNFFDSRACLLGAPASTEPACVAQPSGAAAVWRVAALASLLAIAAAGCTGLFGGSEDRGKDTDPHADWSEVVACDMDASVNALRRLSAGEYSNTVCDVLGLCDLNISWVDEGSGTAFDKDVFQQSLEAAQVFEYLSTARLVADGVV